MLISALSVGSAAAQEPVGIEIVERGLYTLEVVGVQQDPSGVSHDIVRNICHISSSTSVPKKRDVHFGFRYRLTGVPEGQEVELHAITRYPSLVMPPNGPRPLTTSGYTNRLKAGVVSYHGYGFDYDWELIPGRWSLEIWQGNRKLAAQPFDVTDGPSEVRPSDSADCFELSS
ncbi:MAG TPA: DUF3859 domain-containing protein [Reyranella sp.]|nr:DUF3859 domain-containing protein [Reyranella sp.]